MIFFLYLLSSSYFKTQKMKNIVFGFLAGIQIFSGYCFRYDNNIIKKLQGLTKNISYLLYQEKQYRILTFLV
jgi:hypothetical protein